MFGNVNWYFIFPHCSKERNNWLKTIFLAGENTSVLIIFATTVCVKYSDLFVRLSVMFIILPLLNFTVVKSLHFIALQPWFIHARQIPNTVNQMYNITFIWSSLHSNALWFVSVWSCCLVLSGEHVLKVAAAGFGLPFEVSFGGKSVFRLGKIS